MGSESRSADEVHPVLEEEEREDHAANHACSDFLSAKRNDLVPWWHVAALNATAAAALASIMFGAPGWVLALPWFACVAHLGRAVFLENEENALSLAAVVDDGKEAVLAAWKDLFAWGLVGITVVLATTGVIVSSHFMIELTQPFTSFTIPFVALM